MWPPTDPYRALLRPLLFTLDPERAHALCFGLGRAFQALPGAGALVRALVPPPGDALCRRICGLDFRSPLGLAAGLDKGATLLPLWKDLGFGFVEVGTVTPLPQAGNPRPRVFRLPDERMLLNRMGFNSEGAAVVAARLRNRPRGLVVGGNLGKNRTTPDEGALEDYRAAYRILAPHVDYVTINVSSPNTPGLRRLQAPEALHPLLEGIMAIRKEMGLESQPVFVKLAPDLSLLELDVTVDVVAASGVSGIVATNTTLDRGIVSGLHRERVESWGEGGLSGPGLRHKAREVRRRIHLRLPPHLKVVACGGLCSGEDVAAALAEGASLVQVCTALVYQGPALVGRIHRDLEALPSR